MSRFIKGRYIAIGSLCIALVAAVIGWPQNQSVQEVEQDLTSPETSATVESRKLAELRLETPPLSSELIDLPMPYQLSVDEQGHLVVSSDLRELFEYYLAAHDIRDFDQKQALVKTKLAEALAEPALSEAIAIFDNYIAGKKALSVIRIDESSPLAILQHRQTLLQDYLGLEVYAIFFEDEHRYMQYLLERQRIETSQLSAVDKQAQLSVLDVNLDMEQQFLLQPHMQLQNTGDPIAQVADVRQQYGQEAATRFEAVLQTRSQFKQRIEDFKQQLKDYQLESYHDEDSVFRLQQLLDQQFSETEQLRVRAILGLPLL